MLPNFILSCFKNGWKVLLASNVRRTDRWMAKTHSTENFDSKLHRVLSNHWTCLYRCIELHPSVLEKLIDSINRMKEEWNVSLAVRWICTGNSIVIYSIYINLSWWLLIKTHLRNGKESFNELIEFKSKEF